MIYTDCGTKVEGSDAMPLAFANGVEWSVYRRGQPDRFNNLYRFKRAPLSSALWLAGAVAAMFWQPTWATKLGRTTTPTPEAP
jgi:hypothetical protein